MPMWGNVYMQNSNSPMMEHLSFFHDHSNLLILSILVMTLKMMNTSLLNKKFNRFMMESHETEMFWTTVPALMLIFIALPSLKTLYMMEENINTLMSVKTMAFQWYWNYQYNSMLSNMNISSNMLNSEKMRSESTMNNIIIPSMTPTRMLITSKDVLHSWTIPSLGVKSDATPGRINQVLIMVKRPSIMVGQCSEICGSGHSFMPIYLESPNMKNFLQ